MVSYCLAMQISASGTHVARTHVAKTGTLDISQSCDIPGLTMRARNNAGMKDWLDSWRILEVSFRT